MNQDIYFPSVSNISFFDQKSSQLTLTSRIKQAALMFDNLIFDIGAYTFSSSDNGAFEIETPYEILKKSNFDLPDKPMTSSQLIITNEATGKSFMGISPSNNTKSYFVNFHQTIDKLGWQEEEFIKFKTVTLNEEDKKIFDSIVRNTEDYSGEIEGNHFHQKYIIKNFGKSLIKSKILQTPFIVDQLHGNFLSKISGKVIKVADARIEVLNRINKLLKLKLPDFSSLEAEKILELRKDKLFINFRNRLLKINEYLLNKNPNEIDLSKIDQVFVNELIAEMEEMKPSSENLLLNGFLGLGGSVGNIISLIKDAEELSNFNNSWLAFLMQKPNL